MHKEWVVDMDKDVSLFTIMNKDEESKICVVDDFVLDVVGQGDVACRHGRIFHIHHASNISANILFVSQFT
jgi:hypothetical protein